MTTTTHIATLQRASLLVACAILSCGQAGHAQQAQQPGQQQQQGPAANGTAAAQPPLYQPLAPIGDADNPDGAQGAPAGNTVLSGVQNLSAGLELKRSYWQPYIDVTSLADSNTLETPNGLDWRTWTSISGGLDLHEISQNSDLKLGYTAGGMISNDNAVSNGIIQGLNFAEKYSLRHAAISLLDNFSYLPETAFGFDGLGATTLPATQQNQDGNLQFGPAQQVLIGRNRTLSNSDALELDEFLSARTTLTFSGGYSLLHYFDSGLFN
jgi:hypothetical protein